jgi:hypothetical protein
MKRPLNDSANLLHRPVESKAGSRHCRNSNYWQQLLHNSPSQTSAGTGFSESGAMRALPIVGLLPVRISTQYKNLAQK